MEENPERSHRSNQQRMPTQSSAQLEFITYTNPHMATAISNRQRVRSQAMRHVHRQSRASRASGIRGVRRNEIELDVSPLLQGPVRNPGQALETEQSETDRARLGVGEISQSPVTFLSVSRTDPFFQYPIRMGHRENELYNHLYDETCVMFRTMRNVGFLNRVRQTAAFHELLAMSSWHLAHLNQSRPFNEHLGFSLSATQELQSQINNPVHCSADDAIGAVLVFACCANLLHDSESLNAHMHGLQLMLNHRGGLHTLDSNPLLRIMLYWVDVNGSYFQDIAPRFPPPEHLLPRSRHQVESPVPQTDMRRSVTEEISRFCWAVRQVQDIIRAEVQQQDIWQDTMFPGLHISPILGDLLAMRPADVDEEEHAGKILEAFRLAAILYVSALRARFGIDTLSGDPRYSWKLYSLLSSSLLEEAPPVLLTWILSVAFTSQCLPEQRHRFAEVLQELLATMEITNFGYLKGSIEKIVWDEGILVSQSQSLRTLFG